MRPALRAFCGEMWAIDPTWLPLLSAIAQRPNSPSAQEWVKRDLSLLAGPRSEKLPGSHRAFIANGVAVLPVTGPIFPRANLLTEHSGATSIAVLSHDYQVALASRDVKRIMMVIDSPGGAVSGISAFAAELRAGSRQKRSMAFVSGMAASAAYWIAAAAIEVFVDRTAILGSIGVVAAVAKQVAPDSDGLIEIEIVSSNAQNKRPDPTTENGVSQIRAVLDALEGLFIGDVARNRQTTTAKVIERFGAGGVLVGADAVRVGMADRVTTQAAAMSTLRFGPETPTAIERPDDYQTRLDRLRVAP